MNLLNRLNILGKKNNYKNVLVDFFILNILVTLFSYIKFLDFFRTGGEKVIGDEGDPRFILFIMEHIYKSLSNNIFDIVNPPQFYPYKWTITFSDWLIFPGIFHSFFRSIGFDLFDSFEYSIIISNALFFIFLYFSLRSIPNLNRFFSLYISILISYGYFLESYKYWLQNFSIFLTPLFFYFFLSEEFNLLNVCRVNNFIKQKKYALSGIVIMLSLFSCFYIGLSLLFFALLFFIVKSILYYKPGHPLKKYILNILFSKSFISLFSFSFIFIILNSPALFIADVAKFAESNIGYAKVNNFYLYPFSILVLLGWLNLIFDKLFLKKNLNFLNLEKTLLLIITIVCIIFFQYIPDIWKISDFDKYLSINQIITYNFGSVVRDFTRFFYSFYLLSFIYAGFLITAFSIKLKFIFNRFSSKKYNIFVPIVLIFSLSLIYKFDFTLPYKSYNHEIDVNTHKKMLLDASNQLNNQKDCKTFYLESYDRNQQINQLSAGLISLHTNIPTLNGYSGAYPKGLEIYGNGFMNENYISNLNQLLIDKKIDKNNVCHVLYRTPPFKELTMNKKIIDPVYSNEDIKFDYSSQEDNGNFKVLKDQFGAFYVQENKSSSKPKLITFKGNILGLDLNNQFFYHIPLSILEAENFYGKNQLLTYDHSIGTYQVWEADNNWALIKMIDSFNFEDEKLKRINEKFGSNYLFNTKIDDSGKFFLLRNLFGNFYVQEKLNSSKFMPIIRDSKFVGFHKEQLNYNLVSVEFINGVNQIVDYVPHFKSAYVWESDSKWNFIKDLKVISVNDPKFLELEEDHGVDINNDGIIGFN